MVDSKFYIHSKVLTVSRIMHCPTAKVERSYVVTTTSVSFNQQKACWRMDNKGYFVVMIFSILDWK